MANLVSKLIWVLAGLAALIVLSIVATDIPRFTSSTDRLIVFIYLPSVLILAAITAYWLDYRTRLAAGICLVTAVFSLYSFEAYLRFVESRKIKHVTVKAGVNLDSRTKAQVAFDLRSKGVDAYPAVFPSFLLQRQITGHIASPLRLNGKPILPLGGIGNVLTVLCREQGSYTHFQSDELGFNNPSGVWAKKKLDIAAIGDSFTQGFCVPPNQNYVSLIRARYDATLNLGMAGNGPLLELATLKEFLPAFKPRTVLWFFFEGNDLTSNLSVEKKAPLLMSYLDSPAYSQNLAGQFVETNTALRNYVDALFLANPRKYEIDAGPIQNLIDFMSLTSARKMIRSKHDHPPIETKLFQRILQEAMRAVKSWGGNLYLVYIPSSARYIKELPESSALHQIKRTVESTTVRLGLPLIDIAETLSQHPNPLSLYPLGGVGHFNSEGHELVAAKVMEVLENE